MIKLLILDFDGTLVDSWKVIYGIMKSVIEDEGYSLDKSFKEDLGDWPTRVHLAKIGIKKNIDWMMKKIGVKILISIPKLKPASNIGSLEKIKIPKVILSNNSNFLIRAFLELHRIGFIDEIHTPSEFHKKSEGIRLILKEGKLKPSEVIYVGDRDKDILAARKLNCFSVAISNEISWNSRKELLKSRPDFIISNLRELKKIVKKLDSS